MATLKLNDITTMPESGGTVTYNTGTLSSGVTFPAGHCVQVVKYERTDKGSSTSTSHQEWADLSITYKTTNPLIIVDCIGMWGAVSVSDGVKDIQCWTKLRNNTTGTDLIQHRYMNNGMQTTGKASVYGRAIRWIGVVTVSSGVTQEYGFYGWSTNSSYSRFVINTTDDTNDQGNTFLTITEIAQ